MRAAQPEQLGQRRHRVDGRAGAGVKCLALLGIPERVGFGGGARIHPGDGAHQRSAIRRDRKQAVHRATQADPRDGVALRAHRAHHRRKHARGGVGHLFRILFRRAIRVVPERKLFLGARQLVSRPVGGRRKARCQSAAKGDHLHVGSAHIYADRDIVRIHIVFLSLISGTTPQCGRYLALSPVTDAHAIDEPELEVRRACARNTHSTKE